jgi:tetratricopeptide (TPR) repeat protein
MAMAWKSWRVRMGVMLGVAAACGPWGYRAMGAELADEELLFAGKYRECLEACTKAITAGNDDPLVYVLKARVEMTLGKYEEALKTCAAGLEKNPGSLEVRLAAVGVLEMNERPEDARTVLTSILALGEQAPWRYTEPSARVALGRAMVRSGVDARKVLEQQYDKAKKDAPQYAEVYIASGDLALEKHDYALAAEMFGEAAKRDAGNPAVYLGLAKANEDDNEKAGAALAKAMAINPSYPEGMLFEANHLIDAEGYEKAGELLKNVLAINPHNVRAWAYRAVLANLSGKHEEEAKAREEALGPWKSNPEVDYLIGWKLSQNYRFKEGAAYQRRALSFVPDYLPAKGQLCQDLLRLAQDEEGWRLADEVFKADPYDATAYNLVTLRDHIAKFQVITTPHFQVRMDAREAEIYGGRVTEMLEREYAKMTAKYGVKLSEQTHIEIFPEQKDFQIRTFGMPMGEGFLGVCFGPVVTMNSPAALAAHPENWQAILWHEFCHSITLAKTNNKMPRWLSEGISVYEEKQENRTWGQVMTPAYRDLVLAGKATPVSRLTSAFLRPPSGLYLMFAYYESSMVVDYIDRRWGTAALNAVLEDLGNDVPINEALARHTEPIEQLDADFAEALKRLAEGLAPDADLSDVELPADAPSAAFAAWNKEHPANFWGLMGEGRALLREQKFKEAQGVLERAARVYPGYAQGNESPWSYLAAAYRGTGDAAQEREALEKFLGLSSDSLAGRERFLEIAAGAKDWEAVEKVAGDFLAINPLVPTGHRYLAEAAAALGDRAAALAERRTLLLVDPVGRVENHYQLGRLLFEEKQLKEARREVVLALEEAPRYREAHRLLLKIVGEMEGTGGVTTQPAATMRGGLDLKDHQP